MAAAKTTRQKKLTRSLEDYLETIFFLIRDGRVARVRDIARNLKVGMPSVTAALKSLSRRKLVNYDPYEFVTLTDRGRELAEEISRRHYVIRRFLTGVLGLEPEAAEANACRMEHAVDSVLMDRLQRFVEFVQRCPRCGSSWVESFEQFRPETQDRARCRSCIGTALRELRKKEVTK